jgi:uncharacterized protein YodC (DUF2158 family)
MQFEIGDVVRLKSGGPLMTVIKLESDGQVICQWFEKNQPQTGTFLGLVLEDRSDENESVEIDPYF